MVSHRTERDISCPLLKHLTIDAEAVVAGQCHKVGILPRAVALLNPSSYGLRLLLQAFRLQGRHPGMYHQARQVWYDLIARRVTVGSEQFLVVLTHVPRHIQLQLRQIFTLGILYIRVDDSRHVEHHVVVVRVFVVTMHIPVARLLVDLHIPHPQRAAYLHFGIEEVRSCIVVVQARVNHFDVLAICCLQFPQRE